MGQRRADHDAVVLADRSVMVIGGRSDLRDPASALATTEQLDVASSKWEPAGTMADARYASASVVLADGRVLVTGGIGPRAEALATVEIYEPKDGTWQPAKAMSTPRTQHTATLLAGGTVLVVGGYDDRGAPLASAERFDPGKGSWTEVEPMSSRRADHTATELAGGDILIVGGSAGDDEPLRSVERYDVRAGRFVPVADIDARRSGHAAVRVGDDRVLVTGGCCDAGATSESYQQSKDEWSGAGELRQRRELPGLVELPELRALAIGGQDDKDGRAIATTEVWNLRRNGWEPGPTMEQGRVRFATVVLGDGRVLVVGGVTPDGATTPDAEVLDIDRLDG